MGEEVNKVGKEVNKVLSEILPVGKQRRYVFANQYCRTGQTIVCKGRQGSAASVK